MVDRIVYRLRQNRRRRRDEQTDVREHAGNRAAQTIELALPFDVGRRRDASTAFDALARRRLIELRRLRHVLRVERIRLRADDGQRLIGWQLHVARGRREAANHLQGLVHRAFDLGIESVVEHCPRNPDAERRIWSSTNWPDDRLPRDSGRTRGCSLLSSRHLLLSVGRWRSNLVSAWKKSTKTS